MLAETVALASQFSNDHAMDRSLCGTGVCTLFTVHDQRLYCQPVEKETLPASRVH